MKSSFQKVISGGGIGLARGIAAFVLNTIAAITGPPRFDSFAYQFLRVHASSVLTLPEREIIVSTVFAAVIGFCVCRFWSTKTAKWVWILPLQALFIRMIIFAVGRAGSGSGADPNYGLWHHFFAPDYSKGFRWNAEYTDFLVVTTAAVRASAYSMVAWVLERWERRGQIDSSAEPAPDKQDPPRPTIWEDAKFHWLTATNVLIGINLAVYAAMVISGFSPWLSRLGQRADWGAMDHAVLDGQYWRLVTHAFVHLGIFHLTSNMVCLWWVGRLAEKIFGGFLLSTIYLLTAFGAGLLILAWDPWVVSEGASGAILGIAGALIAAVAYGKLDLPANLLFRRRMSVFIFIFLLGSFSPYVSTSGHLGGFMAGVLVGLVFGRSLRAPSPYRVLAPTRLFQGREAIERRAYDSAVQYLQTYIAVHPKAAEAHALLGYSFHALDRPAEAIQEYQLAVSLGCTDEIVKSNLAGLNSQPAVPNETDAPMQKGYSTAN